jgi:hypothetical protein
VLLLAANIFTFSKRQATPSDSAASSTQTGACGKQQQVKASGGKSQEVLILLGATTRLLVRVFAIAQSTTERLGTITVILMSRERLAGLVPEGGLNPRSIVLYCIAFSSTPLEATAVQQNHWHV